MFELSSPLAGIGVRTIQFDLEYEPDAATLACLTDGELRHLHTFRQRADRVRFGGTRAALRTWLGAMLDVLPLNVPLISDRYGKPILQRTMSIGFNVSHSGDRALIAVGRNVGVGADIEQCVPLDVLSLAEAAFSQAEYHALGDLSPDSGTEYFYALWTAREALGKAFGTGISDPRMRSLALRPRDDGTWHMANQDAVDQFPFDISAVRIASLNVTDGYRAAVATVPIK